MAFLTLTACIDTEHADIAATRVAMAYELLDMLGEFSIDGEHSYAETLNVLMLVMGLACDGVQVPEMVALSEFQTVLKLVKKHRKRLGPKATARELITEMHLDHRKDRKR